MRDNIMKSSSSLLLSYSSRCLSLLLPVALLFGIVSQNTTSAIAASSKGVKINSMVQLNNGQAPDFQLEDVNQTSLSYNLMVSPRDFLGAISAWYFGSAT